jgi:HEAT repeat protein
MRQRTTDVNSLGLGKIPGTSVLPKDLGSEQATVRNYARRLLVAIGRQAIPALAEALKFGNVYARGQAARALGEIGDPTVAPVLVKALADRQLSVHAMAAEALIALGEPALPAMLNALIEQPASRELQLGARVVLRAQAHESWHEQIQPLLDALDSANPEANIPAAARRLLESPGVREPAQ